MSQLRNREYSRNPLRAGHWPETEAPAPDSSVTAALAAVARFGREVRNAFPDLHTDAFIVEKTDGRGTHAPQWGCRASGQALGAARPATQAPTPAQAIQQLKALVGHCRQVARDRRTAAALECSSREG